MGPSGRQPYSGDSGPCEALEQAAREVDLLLCECAALEQEQMAVHLSATQVGQLARAARCRRVVLTHIYPHVEATDPAARVREHFAGPVELAVDGPTGLQFHNEVDLEPRVPKTVSAGPDRMVR